MNNLIRPPQPLPSLASPPPSQSASHSPSQSPSPGCGPIRPVTDAAATTLRQQVFECVRGAGHAPRVDVAKALGVSPASVTALTSDLIAQGFLQEVEGTPREGSRGRPPVALAVRPQAGYVVGIKLSDEVHSAVLIDFAGEPVAHASLSRRNRRRDPGTLLDEAETLYRQLMESAAPQCPTVLAIGLGLPGIVDHNSGTVPWSPILTEGNLPLRDMARDRFGIPVEIDNDANLVTLSELWFGAGRAMADFAVVTIEHGVGMGLVVNHRLYRGAHSLGMELGHTKVQMDGALCRCGHRGCLEAYVADYALVREASTALDWYKSEGEPNQVLLESLYDQAKAGNEAARSIFRRAGRYLALGLANVANLFDPSLIVLSGERMRYDYLYAEEVLAEMRALTLNTTRSAPTVEIAARGDLVWARGAAALALSALTDTLSGRELAR
ncbi:ROK family protein [Brevirhabdus sp.]|uniref:ROK family protein n=1 Tax=Brevirhabdus sp. TaxID=2004514 RepID=UPI00405A31CB